MHQNVGALAVHDALISFDADQKEYLLADR